VSGLPIGGDRDVVDWVIERWAVERPDLDTSSIAVAGRLLRVAELLQRRLEVACRSCGLSLGELAVLTALRRSGRTDGLSPGQLGGALLISSGGVTKRVVALEERGLVARSRDERDGRGVLVSLTEAGRALVDESVGPYLEAERSAISTLSADEQATLAQLLRPLLAALEASPAIR